MFRNNMRKVCHRYIVRWEAQIKKCHFTRVDNTQMSVDEAEEQQLKGIQDSKGVAEERQLTQSVTSFKSRVPLVTAKLSEKSDSDMVVNLFIDFQSLVQENSMLRRRNRDLLDQLFVSGPNYSTIKEELEGKFENYKKQIERENLLKDIETQKIINELKHQNAKLQKENETLKQANQAMSSSLAALQTTVAELKTKADDVEFQNYFADVFRYIRDGIVAKGVAATFPKVSDCMNRLYSCKELEYPDKDDFEESEFVAIFAEVDRKNDAYRKASVSLTGLGLDASLVRDLRVFNKAHNEDINDEDCKLQTRLKIISKKNQTVLKELREKLKDLNEKHAAFPLKDRLILWLDSVIV